MKTVMGLGLIILSTVCISSVFAENSRLLASINAVYDQHKVNSQVSVLKTNIDVVNRVREGFILTWLAVYNNKNELTPVEVQAFSQELDTVINEQRVMKKDAKKNNYWVSPGELVIGFNEDQKEDMQGLFDHFNNKIYPLFQEGIEEQKKGKLVKGLERWDKNSAKYTQFIQARIGELNALSKLPTKKVKNNSRKPASAACQKAKKA